MPFFTFHLSSQLDPDILFLLNTKLLIQCPLADENVGQFIGLSELK